MHVKYHWFHHMKYSVSRVQTPEGGKWVIDQWFSAKQFSCNLAGDMLSNKRIIDIICMICFCLSFSPCHVTEVPIVQRVQHVCPASLYRRCLTALLNGLSGKGHLTYDLFETRQHFPILQYSLNYFISGKVYTFLKDHTTYNELS